MKMVQTHTKDIFCSKPPTATLFSHPFSYILLLHREAEKNPFILYLHRQMLRLIIGILLLEFFLFIYVWLI